MKNIVIMITESKRKITKDGLIEIGKKTNTDYVILYNITKEEMIKKFKRFMKTGEMLLICKTTLN